MRIKTNSVFLINKPEKVTSFDVIRKLRKITNQKKMGHSGTLDPFATGVLIICLNKATKILPFLIDKDKEYIAKIAFGFQTNSGDKTGEIVKVSPYKTIAEKQLISAVEKIKETIIQVPPNYSAVKINGVPAYKIARENKIDTKILENKKRNIRVLSFEILDYSPFFLTYRAKVSKGTYIRTLSEQFASLLNTVCTTINLERLSIGSIHISKAVNLESINSTNWYDYCFTVQDILLDLPQVFFNNHQSKYFKNGNTVELEKVQVESIFYKNDKVSENVLILCEREKSLLGIGTLIHNKMIKPKKVFV